MTDYSYTGAFFNCAHPVHRVGIMGGTFDPVHLGHLHCAEQARDACELDVVVFVPAGKPAFKLERQLAPASERLAMCELATADNPKFITSDMESDECSVSYTIDTIRRMRSQLSEDAEIYFIAGSDLLSSLHQWHEAEALAKLCSFIFVGRPYVCADDAVGAQDALETASPFQVREVRAPMLDISSSEIRERLRRGASVRYLVPEAVRAYIYDNRLYGAHLFSSEREA